MIAKAECITHGANATRYSVDKDKAELVKVNLLPAYIEPEAMWQRMQLHQKKFEEKINRYRKLEKGMIRMEISPTSEETQGWTMDDWVHLANEYIHEFDNADMRNPKRKTIPKHTNLHNSQYVVSLHHDSKGRIDHLHINANRVDNDGNVNTDKFIGERAVIAAQVINMRRGWGNPEEISRYHKAEITDACFTILKRMHMFNWDEYKAALYQRGYLVNLTKDSVEEVRGYSIMRGNSKYKSSDLGQSRNLMPSKIQATWERLHDIESQLEQSYSITAKTNTATNDDARNNHHPEPDKEILSKPIINNYTISTDEYHDYDISISEKLESIINDACTVPDNNPFASIEDIQNVALLLFAEYMSGAISMSRSCGGGSNDLTGWGRDKDEDDENWARRCARKASKMCQRSRGLRR